MPTNAWLLTEMLRNVCKLAVLYLCIPVIPYHKVIEARKVGGIESYQTQ